MASSPTSISTATGWYAADQASSGIDGRRADCAPQSRRDHGWPRGAGAIRLGLSAFRRWDAGDARHGGSAGVRRHCCDVVRDDGCDDGPGRVPYDSPLCTGLPPFERARVQSTNSRLPRRISCLLARFRLGRRRNANLGHFARVDGACQSPCGGGTVGCRWGLPTHTIKRCLPRPLPITCAVPQPPLSARPSGRVSAGNAAWCLLRRLLLAFDGIAIRRRRDEPHLDSWPHIVGCGGEAASWRILACKNFGHCADRLGSRPDIWLGRPRKRCPTRCRICHRRVGSFSLAAVSLTQPLRRHCDIFTIVNVVNIRAQSRELSGANVAVRHSP